MLLLLLAGVSLSQAKGIDLAAAQQRVQTYNQKLASLKKQLKANEDRMTALVKQMGSLSSQGPAFNADFKKLEQELQTTNKEHGRIHEALQQALRAAGAAIKEIGKKHRVTSNKEGFSVEKHDKYAGRGVVAPAPRPVRVAAN